MKADEINAAIAKAQGWKRTEFPNKNKIGQDLSRGIVWCEWTHPILRPVDDDPGYDPWHSQIALPNYHGSLDAIVPVVRAMPYLRKKAVLHKLFVLTSNEYVSLATPAQWCEAYLKAEGLWK